MNAAKKRQTRWSSGVMERSNALDLQKGVFTQKDPYKIALSLMESAKKSKRRKASPFRSAMSMLSFHINRSGIKLSASRRAILEQAKDQLRRLFSVE